MVVSSETIFGLGILGIFAGLLGALVGIGGGVVLIPALVLIFGINIKIAVAASLVAVVATSTAAGSVYVGKGLSNMRLGMTLEIATTLGGLTGGLLAALVPSNVLAKLFAVMMIITAILMLRSKDHGKSSPDEKKADLASPEPESSGANHSQLIGHEEPGRLAGSFYDVFEKKMIYYEAVRVYFGASISYIAGVLSGLLGVGGGFIKVPAMNLGMKVPLKVAAATSNFMIGVTAISSLFVYFARGFVHPWIAAPSAIGIVIGALLGTKLAGHTSNKLLKIILAVVLVAVSIQMFFKSNGV